MTCTDCRAEGADCLTADRVRVCSDCLYERVVKERDEACAEVERFRNAVREKERLELEALRELDEARKYAQSCEWALEAEQEYTARLKADLALECQEVAERQREACAAQARSYAYLRVDADTMQEKVRATPLVTEGEP